MKTTPKQFELFKKECAHYIEKFHLNGFEFRFFHTDNPDIKAQIQTHQLSAGVISIYLGKDWKNTEKITDANIKAVAKHEMVHALIAEYANIATSRYVTEPEEYLANEKLTNKLEKLL